jgi:glycosyltransferase involved in cell wall biosynthesis
VINSHPIQYFAPLYAYINRATDIELIALYLSDLSIRGAKDAGFGVAVKWDIDLLAGYPYQFVGSRAATRELGGFTSIVAPELWYLIRRARFDAVIVHGYAIAANHLAIAAARSVSTPVLMRCETHQLLRRNRARGLKSILVRGLFGQCAAFLAIGSANADYYRALGIDNEKIFMMPYCVDNARFATASEMMPEERRTRRAAFGVGDDRPILLFSGKYLTRKHPDKLIEAARILVADGLTFHLAMVGSGELEGHLRRLVAEYNLPNVSFHGFVNQAELPKIYAACDVFVLPSENEPWGLAVNEAMACGLPVVTTAEVGSARDLIDVRRSGITSPTASPEDLARTLRPIVRDDAHRQTLASGARARIAQWSYEEATGGLLAALAFVSRR